MNKNQILRLRKSLGITQAQLAALVGVQHSAVSHWEAGTRTPSKPLVMLLRGIAQKKTYPQDKAS